jgi:tetratricopeptide (TPR) repeat protein
MVANVYTVEKSYDKAQPYLLRVVDLGEKMYGTQDYRGMAALYLLCDNESHLQNANDTEACYRRLLPAMETVYGAGNPALVPALGNYAQSLRSLGRVEEAAKFEERAQSIRQSGPQN